MRRRRKKSPQSFDISGNSGYHRNVLILPDKTMNQTGHGSAPTASPALHDLQEGDCGPAADQEG